MKKTAKVLVLTSILISFISCGSKPAPEETETPSAPVVEQTQEEQVVSDSIDETSLEDEEAARKAAEEAAAREAEEAAAREAAEKAAAEKAAAEEAERIARLQEARNKAMEAYKNAQSAKQRIDEKDLASYAQSDYDEGWAKLVTIEEYLATADELDESLFETAEAANKCFITVLNVAYKKLAKEERTNAYEAKKQADSVKAGVARREDYSAAAEAFTKGDTLYSMQNAEKAYENYVTAKEQFTTLYNEVFEQRAAAAAAIEAAKKSVMESALLAEEADQENPITGEVDGIEEEDAVLLEEDEYEDPVEAEADIPETIDDVYEEEVEETVEEVEETVEEGEAE